VKTLLYIFLFLCITSVYTYTGNNTIPSYRDSGDLISSAYTLGIAHPPGYPLYIQLAKTWTIILPFSNVGYRVNLLSSIFLALTIILLFKIASLMFVGYYTQEGRIFIFYLLPLCLAFGFINSTFSLAHVSEMYTLNLLLVAMITYFSFSGSAANAKCFYLSLFLLGLGMGNHHTIVFLLPGIIILFSQQIKNIKTLLMGFLFFILGSSINLFLIVRSSTDVLLDWGDPQNIRNFIRVLLRSDYGGLRLHPEYKFSLIAVPEQVKFYFHLLSKDFNILSIVLGFCGMIFMYIDKNSREKFLYLATSYFLSGIVFVAISGLPPNELSSYAILEPHLLMPNFFFAMFAIYGFLYIIKASGSKFVRIVLVALIYFSSCATIFKNVGTHCHRREFYAYDYGINLSHTLPKDAILYDTDDVTTFIIYYLKYCMKRREDIKLIVFHRTLWGYKKLVESYPELFPRKIFTSFSEFVNFILDYNTGKENFYTDIVNKIPQGKGFLPAGVVYKIVVPPYKEEAQDLDFYDEIYYYRGKYFTPGINDFFTRRIVEYYSNGYTNYGLYLLNNGEWRKAEELFNLSLKINPYSTETINNLGVAMYLQKNYKEAISYWLRALKLSSTLHQRNINSSSIFYNIGLAYYQVKDLENARHYLEKAVKEGYPLAYNDLGLVYFEGNAVDKALVCWEQLLNYPEIVERHPEVFYNLSLCYRRLGNAEKAEMYKKKFFETVSTIKSNK
jgi:tetratricopeptide (TPR) repeat protein